MKKQFECFDVAAFQLKMTEAFLAHPLTAELNLSELDCIRLVQYGSKLVETNQVMNLTAIVDPYEVVSKHMIDSLMCLKTLDRLADHSSVSADACHIETPHDSKQSGSRLKLIDVGTGAGFPGLVLAIVRPHWQIVLMDALQKRVRFLESIVDALELQNVTCVHMRAEEGGQHLAHREQYDVAVARAVAALPILAEYLLPFVKVEGHMVAMKGQCQDEIVDSQSACCTLGGQTALAQTYTLPCLDEAGQIDLVQRTMVVIEKVKQTPKMYPRANGMPKKKPLL